MAATFLVPAGGEGHTEAEEGVMNYYCCEGSSVREEEEGEGGDTEMPDRGALVWASCRETGRQEGATFSQVLSTVAAAAVEGAMTSHDCHVTHHGQDCGARAS